MMFYKPIRVERAPVAPKTLRSLRRNNPGMSHCPSSTPHGLSGLARLPGQCHPTRVGALQKVRAESGVKQSGALFHLHGAARHRQQIGPIRFVANLRAGPA
jgi:hypothetical protein